MNIAFSKMNKENVKLAVILARPVKTLINAQAARKDSHLETQYA